MKRREFLKWLGVGTATVVGVPLLLAETAEKAPIVKSVVKATPYKFPHKVPRGLVQLIRNSGWQMNE